MKLTGRQINLIKCIQKNPNADIKELAEIAKVSPQTVKADLQDMEGAMKQAENLGIRTYKLYAQGLSNNAGIFFGKAGNVNFVDAKRFRGSSGFGGYALYQQVAYGENYGVVVKEVPR